MPFLYVILIVPFVWKVATAESMENDSKNPDFYYGDVKMLRMSNVFSIISKFTERNYIFLWV